MARIIIVYHKEAEDDLDTEGRTPLWWEGCTTIEQAQEALGRLERFIQRKKMEESLLEDNEEN